MTGAIVMGQLFSRNCRQADRNAADADAVWLAADNNTKSRRPRLRPGLPRGPSGLAIGQPVDVEHHRATHH
jgi:hypothetical protein